MFRHTTLGLLALSLALVSTPAQAGYSNNSGTICKAFSGSQASNVDYVSTGARSTLSERQQLICPVSRIGTSTNGAIIYVDVRHLFNATTNCSASSFSYTGELMATASGSFEGSGFGEITLDLSGPLTSDQFSDYSVLCTIPGGLSAILLGVDLNEL